MTDRAKTTPLRSETRLIIGICLLAAIRVFVFSAVFPFFNNVDEIYHVDTLRKYARGYLPTRPVEPFDPDTIDLLIRCGTFEFQTPIEYFPDGNYPPPLWKASPQEAAQIWSVMKRFFTNRANHEAHAQPVYYLVTGLWYNLGTWAGLAGGRDLYWVRFLNAPLYGLLVWCAYCFCRQGFPMRTEMRIGVPALLAFLPQDVFYSINNDALSALMFTLSLVILLRWSRHGHAKVWLGALVGLLVAITFLVKYTNIALVAIFGVLMLIRMYQSIVSRHRQATLAGTVAILAAVLPVLIWFAHNNTHLNSFTGTTAKVKTLGWTSKPFSEIFEHPLFTPAGLWMFWGELMQKFWRGGFVWRAIRMAHKEVDLFYVIASSVLLIAAAAMGIVRRYFPQNNAKLHNESEAGLRPMTVQQSDPIVMAMVWTSVVLSICSLAVLSIAFDFGNSSYPSVKHPYFTSGRLIIGMVVPFLILYVEGLAFLLKWLTGTIGPLVFVGLTCVIMTISEIALTWPVFPNEFNWFHLP